jgi:adenosylcobinamide-phosphate synthase
MRRPFIMLLAVGLDMAVGELPTRIHPVVWMGRLIDALRGLQAGSPRRQLCAGVVVLAAVSCTSAVAGFVVNRALRRLPRVPRFVFEAFVLSTLISLRELLSASRRVDVALRDDRLDEARHHLRDLVSRDTSALSPNLIASAATESLAENLADSVAAPLLAYQLGGLPAAAAYRAINTLDAMIGYRGDFEHFGKASARADDLANVVPSRVAGALIVAASPLTGADAPSALRLMLRDAGTTSSPNAGWPMSAMAGALGVRLEKVGHYVLGAPLPPTDVPAVGHARHVVGMGTALFVVASLLGGWTRRRLRRCD